MSPTISTPLRPEAEQHDDGDAEHDRHERAGHDRRDALERHHDRQRAGPTASVQPVGRAEPGEEAPELLEEVAVGSLDAEDLGSWPAMIVSARPTMKPFSTGSEMKLARKPNRRRPAATATIPVVSASATVSATKSSDPRLANSATAAADSAAVAAMGPAIRCFELPKAA